MNPEWHTCFNTVKFAVFDRWFVIISLRLKTFGFPEEDTIMAIISYISVRLQYIIQGHKVHDIRDTNIEVYVVYNV